MNIEEALEVLKKNDVTDSVQMLRRWIRQGKIKAEMESKKTGYVVDSNSLNEFIVTKKRVNVKEKQNIVGNVGTYEEGLADGIRIGEMSVREAILDREKELILKGLKEETINYTSEELFKGFGQKEKLKKHLTLLDIYKVTLNVLGNWIYDEKFNILIDVNSLQQSNQKLKTKAKKEYTQKLFKHLESNK